MIGHRARMILAAALVVNLTGCFSVDLAKEPPVRQTYLFGTEVPASSAGPIVQSPVLLVQQASAPSPDNGRQFLYRTGENEHVADYYNGFLISPAEQLSQLTRAWLQAVRAFPQVVDSDSGLEPDAVLEMNLVELRADHRDPTSPKARIRIRVHLLGLETSGPPEATIERRVVRFQKNYEETVALPSTAPDDLVAGWDQAIAKILGRLTDDLRPFGAAAASK